ncbi:MAG: MBOAT family O-acyltransferase [Bdellovibrionota bacterium]
MLFTSTAFLIVFLPLVLHFYYRLGDRSERSAAITLICASLIFYASWNPRDFLLIGFSIASNYWLSKRVEKSPSSSKAWFIFGLALNLSLLAYFKYAGFILTNLGLSSGWAHGIVLPLAISFYTFQQIAYLAHIRERRKAGLDSCVPEFYKYCLFILFFPHLIAGPIVRDSDFIHQIKAGIAKVNPASIHYGLVLFCIGFLKKVICADYLVAGRADYFFSLALPGSALGFFPSALGILAYGLQIYFDFSGYSDMALGLAALFNFRLPINFNSPYHAASITDFWRRWHITLSTFLRDYIYIPLGGNRRGSLRRHLNLLATMLLGGLWHGANWTFVIWGGLHGIGLVVCHLFPFKLPSWLGRLLTLVFVMLAWVPFRASSVEQTLIVWKGLFHLGDGNLNAIIHGARIYAVLAIALLPLNSTELAARLSRFAALRAMLLSIFSYFRSARVIPCAAAGTAAFLLFSWGFYKYDLDWKLYESGWLRTNRLMNYVDHSGGSYRQSFLSTTFVSERQAELKSGADIRHILVVGSSFTEQIADTWFNFHGHTYLLSSIGSAGVSFDNAIRGMGTAAPFHPFAYVLGVSPVNLAEKTVGPSGIFSGEECTDSYALVVPDYIARKIDTCRRGDFPLASMAGWQALFTGDHHPLLQLRAFFANSSLNLWRPTSSLPRLDLRNTSKEFDEAGVLSFLETNTRPSSGKLADVDYPALGDDTVFHWQANHPLELMEEGKNTSERIKGMQHFARLQKSGFLVYATPTAADQAGKYPPGYYQRFAQSLASLSLREKFSYADLSRLLPFAKIWMTDYVHATVFARSELISRRLALFFVKECKAGRIQCD